MAKLARAVRRRVVLMKQAVEAMLVREAPEGGADNRDGLTLTYD